MNRYKRQMRSLSGEPYALTYEDVYETDEPDPRVHLLYDAPPFGSKPPPDAQIHAICRDVYNRTGVVPKEIPVERTFCGLLYFPRKMLGYTGRHSDRVTCEGCREAFDRRAVNESINVRAGAKTTADRLQMIRRSYEWREGDVEEMRRRRGSRWRP